MGHSNAVAVQTKIGSMSTVPDEVTSETVDAVHILRRVDDWEKRLNGLYSMVGEWLLDGWVGWRARARRSSCMRN